MKKIFYLVAVAAITMFTSCRKDDQEPSIVGNWSLSEEVVYSGKDNSIINTGPLLDDCDKKNYFSSLC